MRPQPPMDLTAERALLGTFIAVAYEGGRVEGMIAAVEPGDFSLPAHQVIWAEATAMASGVEAFVPEFLCRRIEHVGPIGGRSPADYINDLTENPGHADLGEAMAKRVAEVGRQRKLLKLADWIEAKVAKGETAERVSEGVSAAMAKLVGGGRGLAITTRSAVMADITDRLRRGELKRGLPTGFWALDDIVGGLKPGSYTVVAGRPGMGKSAFLLDLCSNVTREGHPAAMVSLEMPNEQTGLRLLARATRMGGIDTIKPAEAEALAQLDDAVATARELDERAPLYLIDEPGVGLERLSVLGRHLVRHKGVRLLAVDYMGIMPTPEAESRNQAITKLSTGLLALARGLAVPLVMGCQLNRALETRSDKRPCLADIRDSGSIEQDAHAVLFLHRETYYARMDGEAYDPDSVDEAEIIVAKNRLGRTGKARVVFHPLTTSFHNLKVSA